MKKQKIRNFELFQKLRKLGMLKSQIELFTLLLITALFSSCGCPPNINENLKNGKSIIYGQVLNEKGSSGNVLIVPRSKGNRLEFSTWSMDGQKGLFITEVDSGTYTVRCEGGKYSVGPRYGSGVVVEDRSKQTMYFDKIMHIPCGKIVFIGSLKEMDNSISVYFEKKKLDQVFSKKYPNIDFQKSNEAYPE